MPPMNPATSPAAAPPMDAAAHRLDATRADSVAALRRGKGRVRRMGADYLAYALLDAVIDGYFPVLEHLSEVIEELEEEVLSRCEDATLNRVHAVRRLLFGIERVQWRQRDLLASLLRDPESMFSETVRVYLRDVHDHAMQLLDVIVMHREIAAGLTVDDVIAATAVPLLIDANGLGVF